MLTVDLTKAQRSQKKFNDWGEIHFSCGGCYNFLAWNNLYYSASSPLRSLVPNRFQSPTFPTKTALAAKRLLVILPAWPGVFKNTSYVVNSIIAPAVELLAIFGWRELNSHWYSILKETVARISQAASSRLRTVLPFPSKVSLL